MPKPPRSFNAYLFDLDGTLVDTAPDLNSAQNAALSHFGLEVTDVEHTRQWVGLGARVLLQRALANQGAATGDLDTMFQMFLEHYERHLADASTPYPDVAATLGALRQRNVPTAVVTNKPQALATALLHELDLHRYFDLVLGGDAVDNPKPAPDPALHACRQLGVGIHEALFVGDSQTDVDCARAAGCSVACVPYGYRANVPVGDLGADYLIETLADLV